MKNLLATIFAVCVLTLSAQANAGAVSVAAWTMATGAAAVFTDAFRNSDPDALNKCKTTKKAEDGNYSYTVYTKEACKK